MKIFHYFVSRISRKLFLLGIIPLVIVTAIITWHTIETRTQEIEQSLQETSRQAAKNLANISDFALYSGRMDLLERMAQTTANIPYINAVAYLNPDSEAVYSTGLPPDASLGELARTLHGQQSSPFFVVKEPVYLDDTDVVDYEEGVKPQDSVRTLLGWVVIVADRNQLTAKTREILVNHIIISFVVLIAAAILSYFLSHTFLSPIRRMTTAVKELERGNLQTRITPTTRDELAILANGINHLSYSVAEGRLTLENKVAHATRQLQETLENLQKKNLELGTAIAEAEAANQAKSAFLAQMSHELRTPITAIQGFIKLLDTDELRGPSQRYCTIIQQASAQLLQLIDDILDITKLQSNAITIDTSDFLLMDCLEQPLSLMAPIAHEKGLELIIDLSSDVPLALKGDSLRIRQIVYNLIANAIKFTASGHVILKIRIQQHPLKPLLCISVIDTGIGISEQQQALIFEPFSQADNSISRRFGGTGLGLSIVKNLTGLMGGQITVTSSKGKGSTFTLELPLSVADWQPAAPNSRFRNVALFDSHSESRQALEHLLLRFCDTLESCDDLPELAPETLAMTPDLVVFSVVPLASAEEVTRQLTQLRSYHHIPILMISPLSNALLPLKNLASDTLTPLIVIDRPATYNALGEVFSGKEVGPPNSQQLPALNARVLAAEDNEFARILLTALLERAGIEYRTVCNGAEAIAACKEQPFDLIMLDVHMPETTGIEALKEIRNYPNPNQRTPIIMLTADILQQEENLLFAAGANDLVFKPIDETKLFTILQQHLNRAGLGGGQTKPPMSASLPENHRDRFVQEVTALAAAINKAVNDHDILQLRDSLHQLLGIAGVFRIHSLERAVSELHSAVKAENEEKTYAALETLMHEVATLSTPPSAGHKQPA